MLANPEPLSRVACWCRCGNRPRSILLLSGTKPDAGSLTNDCCGCRSTGTLLLPLLILPLLLLLMLLVLLVPVLVLVLEVIGVNVVELMSRLSGLTTTVVSSVLGSCASRLRRSRASGKAVGRAGGDADSTEWEREKSSDSLSLVSRLMSSGEARLRGVLVIRGEVERLARSGFGERLFSRLESDSEEPMIRLPVVRLRGIKRRRPQRRWCLSGGGLSESEEPFPEMVDDEEEAMEMNEEEEGEEVEEEEKAGLEIDGPTELSSASPVRSRTGEGESLIVVADQLTIKPGGMSSLPGRVEAAISKFCGEPVSKKRPK